MFTHDDMHVNCRCTLLMFSVYVIQNLRDALDCIYDAKVPKIWGKVQWVVAVV